MPLSLTNFCDTMNWRDGETLGVALSAFNVAIAVDVDIEVQMKNRPGVENVFSGERSNNQVLAAGVGLRLEIDPEDK